MLNKFKIIFIALTLFCFSFATMYANQNDFQKTIDFYSKMKSNQKKNKEKRSNLSYSINPNFNSLMCAQINFRTQIYNEKANQNFEYDMNLVEAEILSKIFISKFGYNLSLKNQKLIETLKELIETLKEMHSISCSNLDNDKTNLVGLTNLFFTNLFIDLFNVSYSGSKQSVSNHLEINQFVSNQHKINSLDLTNEDHFKNIMNVLSDAQVLSNVFISKFGGYLSIQNQKLIETSKELMENLKEICSICFSEQDKDEANLFGFANLFLKDLFAALYDSTQMTLNQSGQDQSGSNQLKTNLFDLTNEEHFKNMIARLSDLEKLNSIYSSLFLTDIAKAQAAVNNINDENLKTMNLDFIFNNYIQRRDPQNAERIFSLMSFDDDSDRFDCLQTLIAAHLRNKDLASAERIIQSLTKLEEKNEAYIYILKYYTKQNNIRTLSNIFSKIAEGPLKEKARIYLFQFFVRQNGIIKFQRCGFSSNSLEFQKASKFILAIYENNLQEAIQNRPCNYKFIIDNFIELFCSSNQIKQAEQLINIFFDESEKDYYKLYIINAYLKIGNFEEAKRVKDEIQDLMDKLLASNLIFSM